MNRTSAGVCCTCERSAALSGGDDATRLARGARLNDLRTRADTGGAARCGHRAHDNQQDSGNRQGHGPQYVSRIHPGPSALSCRDTLSWPHNMDVKSGVGGNPRLLILAIAGIAGPILFTALVIVQGLIQLDYSHVALPISALAAFARNYS